jgi:hypothetical protein
MAFANPLVISVNAVNKTLQKINQDNYGSEYYLREATQSFRVKIRHTTENAVTGSGKFQRHNVEITQTIFAVAPAVLDTVRTVYQVLRHGASDDAVQVGYLGASLSSLLVQARQEDLVAWVN